MSVDKWSQSTQFYLGTFPNRRGNRPYADYIKDVREGNVLCCPFDEVSDKTFLDCLESLPSGCQEMVVFPVTTIIDNDSNVSTSIWDDFVFVFYNKLLSNPTFLNQNVTDVVKSLIDRGYSNFSFNQKNFAYFFKRAYVPKGKTYKK